MCVQTYGPGKSVAQICVFGLVAVAVLYECWFFDVFDKENMMAVEIFVWNVDSAHILFFSKCECIYKSFTQKGNDGKNKK